MLLLVVFGIAAIAQTAAFDVASLKPEELHPELPTYNANLGRIVHDELTMANVTLSEALRFAYGFNNDSQVAGPGWIKDKTVRFQIDAKAAPGTPREQIRLMLQSLLNERFQLKTHIEEREIAHLELVPGKKELKLRPAQDGSEGSGNRNAIGHIVSNRMTMEVLTTILSRFLGQPILDRTELKDAYVVNLEWMPESRMQDDAPVTAPSIYVAVQEQLGLKLDARKTPLPVIVVDFANKVPIGN